MKNCCDKVDYYSNMEPRFVEYFADEIDEQLSILRQMQLTAMKFDRSEMKAKLNDIVAKYVQQFYME